MSDVTTTARSASSNAHLVDAWLALWNGEYGVADGIIADAFTLHTALPDGGDGSGIDNSAALVDWISRTRAAVPDLRYSVEVGPLLDGDLIAVRWRAEGHYAGGMPGAQAPSGTVINFTGIDILRVDDGRLTEYWLNCDVHVLLAQMQVGS